jgi:cytochrome c oxidase cbb3-type subunit III
MSGFWYGWIVVVTVLNIGAALWLFAGTARRKPGEPKRAAGDTTGHRWDGDLAEYNNPMPRWWLYLFYGTVAFSIAYLVLFPGLGGFAGLLGWSQGGQWRAQTEAAARSDYAEFGRFGAMTVAELERDPAALHIGRNLFNNNCTTCHGSDARGAKGFPNLTRPRYKWGHDADSVVATIGGGREGVMPAWQDTLGTDGVEQVAAYVYSLSGRDAPAPLVAAGREKFATFCAACHGPDGKGTTALGAPDLTRGYWQYGGSLEAIRETIRAGRRNRMPAHLDLLGEQKVRLLAAYVLNLSSPATASAAPDGGPAAAAHATAY